MSTRKNYGKPKARDPASGRTASAATGPSIPTTPLISSTSGAALPTAKISKGATIMATGSNPIMFLDLAQNFQAAIQKTLADVSDLYLQFSQNGGLTPELIHQLQN